MGAPSWIIPLIIATILGQVSLGFGCGKQITETSGNVFEIVGRFASYNCEGMEPWVSFGLFMLLTFTWLIWIAEMLSNNAILGTVSGIVAIVAAIAAFFVNFF